MPNRYIVIEGNIGSGKTTLANKIAERENTRLVLEQFDDNPFLPKFYEDPERYSFTLELSFLAARYKQLSKDLSDTDLFSPVTVADYYFIKSLIFAQSTLEDEEYKLYRQIFNIIYSQLPKPDIYVYLHHSTDRLLEQIANRGRDYEKNISAEYLTSVQENYFKFFKSVEDFPVVVIDCSAIDFVKSEKDFQKIYDVLNNESYNNGLTTVLLD